MTQRECMKVLYKQQKGKEALIVKAYAEAERKGDVARKSNKYNLSAESYARALLKDGIRKGWI
jgi:hypothetical protein